MLLFAEVVVLTLPHFISTAFSIIEYTGENDLSVSPVIAILRICDVFSSVPFNT